MLVVIWGDEDAPSEAGIKGAGGGLRVESIGEDM